jgi:hypothetical protein
MRRPQPASADFFLYARAEYEWARTCSYMRGRNATRRERNVTGREWNATGRKWNATGRGRVVMGED